MRSGLPRWPGILAALLVTGLCVGPLVLTLAGSGDVKQTDWTALRFTVLQAALSAALSVGLAVPLARALARRRFPGRRLLVTLLGAPFLLPAVVAVMGLLAVFGRQGLVNDAFAWMGLQRLSIYGLHGVVLAHVFLNLPLATRILLQGWEDIPSERFRLAATLNAPLGRLLEWPMLQAVGPGALAAIFTLCLTSFSVALILGGGPAATTLELAIYQAIRFEADFGAAARLALLQYALGGAAAWVAFRFALVPSMGTGVGRPVERWDAQRPWNQLIDGFAIGAAVAFLLVPLVLVVGRGLGALQELPSEVWGAAGRSLLVAFAATALALLSALALALHGGRTVMVAGALPLAASSLVLGTGLFFALRSFIPTAQLAFPATALMDGLVALPFALRVLSGPLAEARARHDRLAEMLGLAGWRRVRILILPALRPSVGFAAGLSLALSMGNLGVIALFASEGQATLPLLMAQLMGAYRMEAAAGVGLVTLVLAFGLFWLCDRWGKSRAEG
jgi:thiamine transport system permease protein